MKTLTLDDIHTDPYRLDALLDSGERIEITRSGRTIAEVIPHPAVQPKSPPSERPDFKARLLAMWGPEALHSTESINEQFAELRRERRF